MEKAQLYSNFMTDYTVTVSVFIKIGSGSDVGASVSSYFKIKKRLPKNYVSNFYIFM